MKKITLFLAAFLITLGAIAQRNAGESVKVGTWPVSSSEVLDTLYANSLVAPGCSLLTFYKATGVGYVTGTNSYGDLEKAQSFRTVPASFTITKVIAMVYSGVAATNTSGTSSMTIYAIDNATKAPSTTIGTSQTVANAVINPFAGSLQYAEYPFASPLAVNVPFFASLVLPTVGTNDSLFVLSTQSSNTCSPDSLSWEKWSPSGWYSIRSAWNSSGIPLDVDLAIMPVIDYTIGMPSVTADLVKVFPNPTSDFICVMSAINIENIAVMNAIGQTVYSENAKGNAVSVSCKNYPPGVYFVRVNTSTGVITKKVEVR